MVRGVGEFDGGGIPLVGVVRQRLATASPHRHTNTANTFILPSATTFDGAISLSRTKYDVGVNFCVFGS